MLRENADGNIVLGNEVLSAFKKISANAVWIKPDRYWRWRVDEDEPGREQRGWRFVAELCFSRWTSSVAAFAAQTAFRSTMPSDGSEPTPGIPSYPKRPFRATR
ncbi:DUF6953 family protein [Variovorax sp. M-6]|uniref:DUF6953 family protein n=1 Tax=Variovorax sp. M-6 TaxID=3233041 RepID=UPI003F9C5AE0